MTYKPNIASVPLATGLAWRGGGDFIYEEKLDGVFKTLDFKTANFAALLAGEQMRDGRFYAFDLLTWQGQDVRPLPLLERLIRLASIVPRESTGRLLRPASGSGGEFLELLLARGAEGVVAKRLDTPYGVGWFKAKRTETYYCLVTELNAFKGSVRLGVLKDPKVTAGDWPDGGWLPLRSRFETVKIGSILKVEAFGRTAAGKLREARLCKDTPTSWLFKTLKL